MNAMAKPPVRVEDFVAAMGLAATGVSVVTTDGPAGRFGLTVSAVSSVSAEPPLVLVCINRKSPAMAAVEANGVFAVNLLSAAHRAYAETFSGARARAAPSISRTMTGAMARPACRWSRMPPPSSNARCMTGSMPARTASSSAASSPRTPVPPSRWSIATAPSGASSPTKDSET